MYRVCLLAMVWWQSAEVGSKPVTHSHGYWWWWRWPSPSISCYHRRAALPASEADCQDTTALPACPSTRHGLSNTLSHCALLLDPWDCFLHSLLLVPARLRPALALPLVRQVLMSVSSFYFNFVHSTCATLTLWCQQLSYGYSYKASCARPG